MSDKINLTVNKETRTSLKYLEDTLPTGFNASKFFRNKIKEEVAKIDGRA